MVGSTAMIRALQARLNARAGYPAPSYAWNPQTRRHDILVPGVVTANATRVVEHPTDSNIAAVEMAPRVLERLAEVRDEVRGKPARQRTPEEAEMLRIGVAVALAEEWFAADDAGPR